jgi:hypothetical protein
MSYNRRDTRARVMSRLCLVPLGLMMFLSGCASRSTPKASSIHHYKNIEVSAAELTSRNHSLLALYSSEIETAADKIISESSSPYARGQALLWKADAIPVLQTSLLKADPVAAVVDTWVFIFQMNAYVEKAPVKNRFGASLPVVTDALNGMDREMEHLILTAAPAANIPDLRRKMEAWVAAHPLYTGLSGRSAADDDLIKRAAESDLGALASIKALQEGLGDITARLDSYNTYLPKQARWQAELLVSDLAHNPEFGAAFSNFAAVSKALDRTSNNLDRLPQLASTARNVALADIDNQRLAAQSFLTQERVEVIEALSQQRIAAMSDLRGERLAATADLRSERQTVLDAVQAEEMAAVHDLQMLSQQTLNDFDRRSRRVVDHVFWRAIELVLMTLLLCFLIGWALLRRFTSRSVPSRGHHERAA